MSNMNFEHQWINANTIRFILSMIVTIVIAYMVVTGSNVPEWFIGIAITVYAFYFGTPVVKATLNKLKNGSE